MAIYQDAPFPHPLQRPR